MVLIIICLTIFTVGFLLYLLWYLKEVGSYYKASPNHLYKVVEEKIFSKDKELLKTIYIIKRRKKYVPIWVDVNYYNDIQSMITALKELKKRDSRVPAKKIKKKLNSSDLGLEVL